jgi:hypothetical protein
MGHPNLLILLADQFRHDCVGDRGMRPVSTPIIDKLASGMRGCSQRRSRPCRFARAVRQSLDQRTASGLVRSHVETTTSFMTPTAAPHGRRHGRSSFGIRGTGAGTWGKWHISPTSGAGPSANTTSSIWRSKRENSRMKRRSIPTPLSGAAGWAAKAPIPLSGQASPHWMADRACGLLTGVRGSGGTVAYVEVDLGIPHLPCQPSVPFGVHVRPPGDRALGRIRGRIQFQPNCQRQQMPTGGRRKMAWADYRPWWRAISA